jgi:putative nucleotidyltransferase with HDIG domain
LTAQISSVRDNPDLTQANKLQALSRIPNLSLSQRATNILLGASRLEWQAVQDEGKRLLDQTLSDAIAPGNVEASRDSLSRRMSPELNRDLTQLVEELTKPLVVSNLIVDQDKTAQAREEARAKVPSQRVSYAKDQVIVSKGNVVDEAAIEALEQAGLLETHVDVLDLVSATLMSLLVSGMVVLYLYYFQPVAIASPRRMLLFGIVLVGQLLVAKLFFAFVLPDGDRLFLAFLLPIAGGSMLIASLLDAQLAVLMSGLLGFLTAYLIGYLPDSTGITLKAPLDGLRMMAVYGFGGIAGSVLVHRPDRLNRYLIAGLAVALVSFSALAGLWFLDPERNVLDFAWMAGVSAMNGLLASLLALGAIIAVGVVFGITTRFQLMELAQLNQPLLRRLQDEAPGTFQHSIIVGNLSERAADLVGADALLVRVGCYYHDIGKLMQPGFYIENQMGGSNPHDDLDPHTSADIILEHVRGGTELARRYRLPRRVADFIPEHHGTRLVAYFYREAVQRYGDEVKPADFTYEGPRPQSKETAIVMLADSIEAMVRASPDRSAERIDAIVESVINERLTDGQLDDSNLTLRDLRTLADSFKSTMRAVYHPRVEYPAPTQGEQRRRRALAPVAPAPGHPQPFSPVRVDESEPEPVERSR